MADTKVVASAEKRRPPAAGKGRQKGVPNKTTTLLREAIIEAAVASGSDRKGKDGLIGYMRRLADKDTKSFAMLLGKVLPLQVTGEGGGPIPVAAMACTPAEFAQVAAEVAGKV